MSQNGDDADMEPDDRDSLPTTPPLKTLMSLVSTTLLRFTPALQQTPDLYPA